MRVLHRSLHASSVVKRPMPNRSDEWARSSSVPIARRTYDGSRDADVHALPEESAMSFSAAENRALHSFVKQLKKVEPDR
jgi:hypothetical protein